MKLTNLCNKLSIWGHTAGVRGFPRIFSWHVFLVDLDIIFSKDRSKMLNSLYILKKVAILGPICYEIGEKHEFLRWVAVGNSGPKIDFKSYQH